MKAKLILEDKTTLEGECFGAKKSAAGEVVFSTAMTGYVESLTDPSYRGQILVFTYPLIGNYGVPESRFFQSPKIQVSGLIVSHQSDFPSHCQSQKTLHQWLKQNQIVGISGVDTRSLTQKIRHYGTMLGKIVTDSQPVEFYNPNQENIVAQVSPNKPKIYHHPQNKKTICLVDCGCKQAIIQAFLKKQANVIAVPWNYNPFRQNLTFDGLVFSNGPGNPEMIPETIAIARLAFKKRLPVLGICLGNQILGLAAGAKTYKLKFGHRSVNQPVKDLQTGKCYITSQNHSYAVKNKSLPRNFKLWFVNLNDRTGEGLISNDGLVNGVQFHPEGHPGPQDTEFIFDDFLKKL